MTENNTDWIQKYGFILVAFAHMTDWKLLDCELKVIQEIKGDAPVILHPDKQVPLGHVIDVYDRSRSAGFDRIQFAASQAI